MLVWQRLTSGFPLYCILSVVYDAEHAGVSGKNREILDRPASRADTWAVSEVLRDVRNGSDHSNIHRPRKRGVEKESARCPAHVGRKRTVIIDRHLAPFPGQPRAILLETG